MSANSPIGRTEQRLRLSAAVQSVAEGRGSLVLLAGEAGIGKTRLAEDALGDGELAFHCAAATPSSPPYGPVVGVLRSFLREHPDGLDEIGPLRGQLGGLLPELGPPPAEGDHGSILEALITALLAVAEPSPAAVLLDDLHWSDDATLELLGAVAPRLADSHLLLVGAYRTDELPQSHPLRLLRNDLRRSRSLDEVELEPLSERDAGELIELLLGEPASPALIASLQARSGGNPFFIEEMTLALADGGRLESAAGGLGLRLDADVPLPTTIRDAVLVRAAALPPPAREAAEVAAAAGYRIGLELLSEVAGANCAAVLLSSGLLREPEPGWAEFRHPLARDAVYEDIPWLRRSELHRQIADRLESGSGDPAEIADHWLAARETDRAIDAMIAAIEERSRLHAHRDAMRIGRDLLDLWPEGERDGRRIEVLTAHGAHAELAGDLAEAARAQREVVAERRRSGDRRALADAERRIAGIYALQGDRPKALAARRVAAEAYAAQEMPGDAAAERLVIAGYLQSAGKHAEAAAVAAAAREEAISAGEPGLQARAMGLAGVALVKSGDFESGIAIVREGLALALENELTAETAEVYQRLGTAREVAGDYEGAADALGFALGFCEAGGEGALEHVCLSCMAYVLRELGDWDEVESLCRRLISPDAGPGDNLVADGVLGSIEAWRGRSDSALGLLTRCLDSATRLNVVSMQCDSIAALAWLAARDGDDDRAREYCLLLLDRWEDSEDHHYAVWGLRWACGWFSQRGELDEARACAGALSTIASSSGFPDALAALASALGEMAFAEGDAETAAEQLVRACELHEQLMIPFERAAIQLRAGVAVAAVGDGDRALELLGEAHRGASALGAVPVANEAADVIASMGASLEDLIGIRAADAHDRAGLSRREHEVVRLLAQGLTNREIAERLVLSTRTVDAHVRSIFTKLDCRTRTEAAARAADAGLLDDVRA